MNDPTEIIWVAANYDEPGDGVGKYAARVVEAIGARHPAWRIQVASASTTDLGRFARYCSLRMATCLYAVARELAVRRVAAVVVEYPFLEQSPAILPAMVVLRRACRRAGVKLVLSLHEYLRVGRLRVMSVRFLARLAEGVLVSDQMTQESLAGETSAMLFLRGIPSNIPCSTDAGRGERDPIGFCFFGIVNRSKATEEMLQGWREAWRPGMTLHFVTASRFESSLPGVEVHYQNTDEQVAAILAKNSFLVLPIQPAVEAGSGSFKAGLANGLIPIGRVGETLSDLAELFVRMEDYDSASFARAFRETAARAPLLWREKSPLVAANRDRCLVTATAAEVVAALQQLGIGR